MIFSVGDITSLCPPPHTHTHTYTHTIASHALHTHTHVYRCHKKLEGSHKVNSLKRRREIEISAPSPVHSLDRYHRGADSASSGFVDDVEHDHFKYGMSGKSFLSKFQYCGWMCSNVSMYASKLSILYVCL